MSKADLMMIVDKLLTKSPRKAVTIAASGTSFTFTFEGRGVISRYLLEAPDVAASTTFTLSFVDENSVTIWTGNAHAENANHSIPCDVEIDGRYTVTLTLNQAAGGTGGTAYLTFWLSPFLGNSRILELVAAATGFTIAGGIVSKTLTVDETVALSVKALKTQVIGGDGTAGRVLRALKIQIDDAASAAHILCTAGQIWNGDAHAQSAEFAANETSPDGFWSLDSSGSVLKLLDAGLTGDCVAVLAVCPCRNNSGTAITLDFALSGGIQVQTRNAADGTALNMTTLVDTGFFNFVVFYATSA